MKRIVAIAAVAGSLALPAGASAGYPATDAAPSNPLPECVQIIIHNGPGFVLSTVDRLINNGELPRIMGPFLPC